MSGARSGGREGGHPSTSSTSSSSWTARNRDARSGSGRFRGRIQVDIATLIGRQVIPAACGANRLIAARRRRRRPPRAAARAAATPAAEQPTPSGRGERPSRPGERPCRRSRSNGYPSTPPRRHHTASSPDCCLPGSAPRPSGIRFEQQRGQRGRFVWLVMGSGSGEAARRDPNYTATRADPTKPHQKAPLVEIVNWNLRRRERAQRPGAYAKTEADPGVRISMQDPAVFA